MRDSLSNMSLEELWQLFPIYLTNHNDDWNIWYLEEKMRISSFLKPIEYHIDHIGSTSIKNIWAKPIVDILLEVSHSVSMEDVKNILVQHDYICMAEKEDRKSFCLGYTEHGFADRVFHLHLRYLGDHDELYFRDYMNDHPLLAEEYEKLKLSLWKQYEHDRDAYTEAKSDFVNRYTLVAKKEYKNRY